MPRTLNEEKHAEKRNEILDAALKLVYTKGYEQMTIQDILDSLQMSKGAFYHYFDSKGAVLEALVERMIADEVVPLLMPIIDDPDRSALDKFHCYFDRVSRWKVTQKPFMMEILNVWMADENAIVRQKLLNASIERVVPLLTKIIHQGVKEGVFTTAYPDQVGSVVIHIMQALGDKLVELLISVKNGHAKDNVDREIENFLGALADALERVLGAQKGSLELIDPKILKVWFE